MDYHLFTHSIVYLFGGALDIVLPFMVVFARRKNLDTSVLLFVLISCTTALAQISHVFGANAPDPESSKRIFMFSLSVIPMGILSAHWFLSLAQVPRARKNILVALYASGAVLMLTSIVYPGTYIGASTPKLYFPYYYVPGTLQSIVGMWLIIVWVYSFIELLIAYSRGDDPIKKNRLLYALIIGVYAFVSGLAAVPLVYDISFDPIWSGLFGLYPLFIAYAVVRYQLPSVRALLARAFIYALALSVFVSFISFSNTLTYSIRTVIRDFPIWIVPLGPSVIGVGIGVFFWNKLRESELLKYEFITIIAHKFRTPLTQAKWTLESMISEESNSDKKALLSSLHTSSDKLIDLTGALVELTDIDHGGDGQYTFEMVEVCSLVQTATVTFRPAFDAKHILFTSTCNIGQIWANIDRKRMQFVLQTLLENAAAYTPEGGKVTVGVASTKSRVCIGVTDSGIGVAQDDIPRVFSKFYRSIGAKKVDTEGFGVGLYLAQSIAHRHGGRIEIVSEGENKGSTFTVVLPIAKSK